MRSVRTFTATGLTTKEYEYIRCDADGTTKVLFRVKPILNGGRPGLLATDGAGVYALPDR